MFIRTLNYDDFVVASNVLWKSFYEAEKRNTSMKGMEYFRDLTSPVSLSLNTFDGKVLMFGAFSPELCAVGAVKEKKHILMLYVRPDREKEGIGSALLSYLESQCENSEITLNASDYALGFYSKRGYEIVGSRSEEQGLISTPMMKKIQKNS